MNSDLMLALFFLAALELLYSLLFGWQAALLVFVGIVVIFWIRIRFF